MADFIHNEGFGSIFVNDKRMGDKSPHYTGSAKINGKVVRVAGWVTQTRNGRGDYISLRITDDQPRERADRPAQSPSNAPTARAPVGMGTDAPTRSPAFKEDTSGKRPTRAEIEQPPFDPDDIPF